MAEKIGLQFVGDASSFEKALKSYMDGLSKATNATTTATKQADQNKSSMLNMGSAWKLVGGMIGIYGAGQIARGAIALAEIGAQAKRLETSFGQLAEYYGGSADAILASLQRASAGTVANSALILGANKAMMLGLGANSEQYGQLMEVAAFRARAMGLTTTQAWDNIVTGIGRKSRLILDNLGIIIEGMGETTSRADLMAMVISEGMDMIEAAGGTAKDEASSFGELSASVDNVKEALGKLLAPSMAAGATEIAEGINVWTKNFEMLDTIMAKLDERSKDYEQAATRIQGSDAALAASMGKTADTVFNAQIAIANNAAELKINEAALDSFNAVGLEFRLGMELDKKAAEELRNPLVNLPQAFDATTASIDQTMSKSAELAGMWNAGIISYKEYVFWIGVLNDADAERLSSLQAAAAEMARSQAMTDLYTQSVQQAGIANEFTRQEVGAAQEVLREQAAAAMVAEQAHLKYVNAVLKAADAQKEFSHASISTAQDRLAEALERAAELAQKLAEANKAQAERAAELAGNTNHLTNELWQIPPAATSAKLALEMLGSASLYATQSSNDYSAALMWETANLKAATDAAYLSSDAYLAVMKVHEEAAAIRRQQAPGGGAGRAATFDPSSLISPLLQPSGNDWMRQSLIGTTQAMGDAWDEEARRWADVAARGKDSPWAAILTIPPDIMDEGKETIKAYATQMQAAFYTDPMGTAADPGAMTQRLVENLKASLTQKAAEQNMMTAVWKQFQEDPEAAVLLQQAGIDAATALAAGATQGPSLVNALLGTGTEGGLDPLLMANTNMTTLKTTTDTYVANSIGGMITKLGEANTAGTSMTNAWKKGFDTATKAAQGFHSELQGIKETWQSISDKTVTLTIKVKRAGGEDGGGAGAGPGGTGGVIGMQHGGAFTVPPGYSHDSFPMRVSSGERVIVIPPGASSQNMLNMGGVNINNGMDWAMVEYRLTQLFGGQLS